MTWLTGWNYRKSIIISNSGSTSTDYQVLITIDTASLITATKMRSDCGDIRFTDIDGSTNISYWIESGCNTSSTRIWIKIPSIPAGTKTIYLYYNNPSATTTSSSTDTFVDFIDYNDVGGWVMDTSYSSGSFSTPADNITHFASTVNNAALYYHSIVNPYNKIIIETVVKQYASGASNNEYINQISDTGRYITGNTFVLTDVVNQFSNGQTVSHNSWYRYIFKIDATSSTGLSWYRYNPDESLNFSIVNTTFYEAGALNQPISYIGIGKEGGSSYGVSADYKYWIVHKYAIPEPTTCIGGEEVPTVSWLSGWNRRKLMTVTGSTSGAQTDYQIKLTVHKATGADTSTDIYFGANVKDDFSDLRFTSSDGSTVLNYWIESVTGSAPYIATVWIKIPSIPISPCTTTIYTYYDNPSAVSVSNGTNTFPLYTDLKTSSYVSSLSISGPRYAYRGNITRFSASFDVPDFGFGDSAVRLPNNAITLEIYDGYLSHWYYIRTIVGGSVTNTPAIDSPSYTYPSTYTYDIIYSSSSSVQVYRNGTQIGPNIISGLPTASLGIVNFIPNATSQANWQFIRKYTSPEPTFSTTFAEQVDITYTYRKPITITSGNVLTNYQIPVTINTSELIHAVPTSKMRSGCEDIRFTSDSSGYNEQNWSVSYPYWIESGIDSSSTKIWIRIDSILTGSNTIYMYYGNQYVTSASDGQATFIDFVKDNLSGYLIVNNEDYDGNIVTASSGNVSIVSSQINITVPGPFASRGMSLFGKVPTTESSTITEFKIVNRNTVWMSCRIVLYGNHKYNYWGQRTYPNPTNSWRLVNNAAETNIGTPSYADTGIWFLKKNGTTYTTGADGIESGGSTATDVFGANSYVFAVTAWCTGTGGSIVYDWIRMRKYTATAPTVTISAEQTITAKSMSITPRESPCRIGICIVDVSVTWTNTGESVTFTPKIIVDSTTYSLDPTILPTGDTPIAFAVSGLPVGNHTICPVPN